MAGVDEVLDRLSPGFGLEAAVTSYHRYDKRYDKNPVYNSPRSGASDVSEVPKIIARVSKIKDATLQK